MIILNLLRLTESQKTAFLNLTSGHEMIFAPDGRIEGEGIPVPDELYHKAEIILGNPPYEPLKGNHVLRYLHTKSAGTDRYEIPGLLPEDTVIQGAVGAYGHSVSEHMFAMLLAVMKRLPSYRDQQAAGIWEDLGPARTLSGAQVLCIGTGDLGASFARLCKALGANTAGVRRDPSRSAPGIDSIYGMDMLDTLLPEADVVSMMLPGSAETDKLMDSRRLKLMKKDAILLNGGRGNSIDCDALAALMADGHLFAACLDVTDPEPLPAGHPLWRQKRALITPHSAGGDHLSDTAYRVAEVTLKHLKKYLQL